MYNNETDLQELYEQIEASQPKSHVTLKDRTLRRLMKREKANIERLKQKMKDQKAKEGEQLTDSMAQSEEQLNDLPGDGVRAQDDQYGDYPYLGTPGGELTESAVQRSSEDLLRSCMLEKEMRGLKSKSH